MAAEITRVSRSWFVTTPNRFFPFEYHMRLPLVTWLPGTLYLKIGRLVSYSHVSHRYVCGIRRDDLRLLSRSELRRCFPWSRILGQRITFMTETLIALGRSELPAGDSGYH